MSRVSGDMYVDGVLSAKTNVPSAGSVANAQVAPSAGIASTKVQQQREITFAQANAAAADETRVIHRVYGATGTILAFHAGSIGVCAGDATVTVDLKKNGTTVLTGVITLNSGKTARVAVAGTLSVTALAVGDVLEVVIDATIGTGTLATGVFCNVTLNEDPQ